LEVLSKVLAPSQSRSTKPHVCSVPQRTASLKQVLGREISILEAKEALMRGFRETYGIDLFNGELLVEERELAERLLGERYFKLFP